ncbi:MAG: ABC transporter ATP-binding protein [Syntrophales bacterium]|nr:ABC transporter ATP-binding protein [Syntrophales bacterium]
MLKGRNITKRFGGLTALAGVDFEVRRGEIVGLIGPNGSGKTTLFNVISGIYLPDDGDLFFHDQRITTWTPHRRARMGIGRTFQIVRPLSGLNLLQNVAAGVLYGRQGVIKTREAQDRAMEILVFTGLGDKAHRLPSELVLEDRKRLEIARALALKPEILLLDEVFAGLNATEIRDAIDLTFKIRESFGTTIFMIEHVMKAIMNTCSRIMVLNFGTKITEGTPEEVANHPEVISAYLGAAYAAC